MSDGIIKSQGTHIYFADTSGASDVNLIKLDCPTGLTGIGGGPKNPIDTTCLDATSDRTQVTGLGTPSPITIPVNFIPSSGAHQALVRLKESGDEIQWMALMSDGTMAPTLVADEIVPPVSPNRTAVEWQASVSEFVIDVQTDDIVKATLTLLRSGGETWHFNGPTPT
jgi:hypothetical protein